MFGIAVCLVVALVCVELVGWIVDKILVFLGKGKPLKRAIERGTLTVEKKKYIEQEAIQQDNAEAIKNSIAGDKVKRRLSREERRQVAISELELRREYLERTHIGWYQLIIIFVIGSFLGLIIEEIWMYITAGVTQSRVGLVWGPFSPLYGFCAVFMTLGLWALKKRYNSPVWLVFVLCFVFGGIIEQITGWSMEVLFGAESWSYLHLPDHITQWVAWRYLFVWGLIGVVWYKLIMPSLMFHIGQPTTVRQIVFIVITVVYLVADFGMTIVCFQRSAARDAGVPPQNAFEEWVDQNYSDEWIESRFQNLTIDHSEEGDGSDTTDETSLEYNIVYGDFETRVYAIELDANTAA